MMNKLVIAGALLALTGCMSPGNYNDVIKVPAPAGLEGYWQSKGPQSKLVSPQAIASLIVTKEGDTLDCRQWQRRIALPGKLMQHSGDLYNITIRHDIDSVERVGNVLNYAGMTLERVKQPTAACADYLQKNPLPSPLP